MRVTFFGSDWFSAICFRSVVKMYINRPGVITGIDLVTRALKPSGRGQSTIVIPEIVQEAHDNGISHIEVESAEDFEKLQETDLAIAVSYGRLIPSEYLHRLPLGGINVHPSLLPLYRGAAPLQRAIMDLKPFTGVAVQTLHPTKFDRGELLWRSAIVPISPNDTTKSLGTKLAELGAKGLCEIVEKMGSGTRIEGISTAGRKGSWAKKLSPSDSMLDPTKSWRQMDAVGRALGRLWFMHPILGRVNLTNFTRVDSAPDSSDLGLLNNETLAVRCADGWIGAREFTAAGQKLEPASMFFIRAAEAETKAQKKAKRKVRKPLLKL